MKTYPSFRRTCLLYYFVLICWVSGFVSCGNDHNEISQSIEFGSEGIVPHKEYVVNFPDSLIFSLKDQAPSLSLLIRYNELTKLKDVILDIEYASLYSDSICKTSINVPLFDDKDSHYGTGRMGIFQKEIMISNSLHLGEGFFLSFKTPQENAGGFIDATVFLRGEESRNKKATDSI